MAECTFYNFKIPESMQMDKHFINNICLTCSQMSYNTMDASSSSTNIDLS